MDDDETQRQCEFLLDLFSQVKDYESNTGVRVLPAFKALLQSVPSRWVIFFPWVNASVFLEVMKLLSEKKPVKLLGFPEEEFQVKSFLQCVPYISQLR